MNDRDETTSPRLSAGGERRREEILALAVREAGSTRRRRAARRVTIGGAMLVMVATAAWLTTANHVEHSAQSPAIQAHAPSPQAETPKRVASLVIQPQPQPRPAVVPKLMPPQIVIDRIPTDAALTQQLALPREPKV